MAELKVALEVAQADFERMCVARRIELDESDWNDEDKKSFAVLKKSIVKAISTGSLSIGEDGSPTLHVDLPEKKSFTFKKANGATLIEMDGKTGTARVFAALGVMAGVGPSAFGKLEVPDLNIAAQLFALFFQR